MLKTEMRNPKTTHIDKMSSTEIVEVMQDENLNAVKAISSETAAIAKAIDQISERIKKGGRLFYIGCGTSGRLGIIDAAECPPTYGVPYELVTGIIAGGAGAIVKAVEGAEDNFEAGYADFGNYNPTAFDSLIGISVAGGAAYVLGAFELAKEKGALTIGLTCNEGSKIDTSADIRIHPDTGAEVVTGSTRLKAGSSHKMILNMISTGVMIKLGHVYENLMINLKPANIKLHNRMIGIVSDILGTDAAASEELLDKNDWSIRKTIDSYK